MEQQTLFQLAMDAASEGLWDWDIATNQVYHNPRYLTMLGYAPDELPHTLQTFEGLVCPEDLERVTEITRRSLEQGPDQYEFEVRMRTKSGDYRWILSRGKIVKRGVDGQALRAVGTHVDINDRKEAEQRFKSMVTNIPGAVYRCRLDSDWTMHYISDAIEKISGYPASDFLGNRIRTYASIIHPDNAEEVEKTIHRSIAQRRPFVLEYRIIDSSGRERWVYEKGQASLMEGGTVEWLDGAIFDNTERKEIELALRHSEAKYRRLVEGLKDEYLFYSETTTGVITYVSPSVKNIFGYTQEECLKHFSNFFTDSPLNRDLEWNHQRARAGQRLPPFEYEVHHKNGERRIIEDLHVPVIDSTGKVIAIEGIVRDITDRKRAEGELNSARETLAQKNKELQAANQHILQAMAEGVYGLNNDGSVAFANSAASEMTGWNLDELLGSDFFELHLHSKADGSPYSHALCPVYDTLTRGNTIQSEDDVFWRKDNTCFAVEYTSTPLIQDGEQTGTVIVFQDITERKKAEEALQNAFEEINKLKERLQAENEYLQQEIKTQYDLGEIIGDSPALRAVLEESRKVASADTSVLIQGESGTGKELIARAIHKISPRKDSPLIKVNCGAISPNLIESELFGHVKGSFTGAIKDRAGYFELADGGTIFLDEIGELSLEAQVRLLRALQEQEIERVGSGTPIRVDVRVIAATHRNLQQMVEDGLFRLDLFYRLNVFPLTVPPLRERRTDIPLLVHKFLRDLSVKLDKPLKKLSDASMDQITRYHWPGNIRELQNVIERAAILAQGSVVEITDPLIPAESRTPEKQKTYTLAENERDYILQVLDKVDWVIEGRQGAAAILDVPSSTLRSRMKKLGIQRHLKMETVSPVIA